MLGTQRETPGTSITLCHSQVTPGNAGNTTVNTWNVNTLRHCQVMTGNAQRIMAETLKLSRECYKQTPERHGCVCSSLLTKLNTFNVQVANGGLVPRNPGAATSITPQGGRAPSDQYNPQPSHEPPAPSRRGLWVGEQPGATRGLGAPSHSPQRPNPDAPSIIRNKKYLLRCQLSRYVNEGVSRCADIDLIGITGPRHKSLDQVISCSCCTFTETMA